jgi:hypothetical protein
MRSFFINNINGILGTLVFHLLIIAIFMAARLSSVNQDDTSGIMINFDMAELPDIEIPKPETRTAFEQYLDNVLRSNMAVNEAEERPLPDQFKNLDASETRELDQRVAEILQKASAGQMPVLPEFPEISMEVNKPEEKKEQKKAEPYTGPTNIYYNLQGRRALWLPVPIYKCPDKGIVTVDVLVNQLGNVVQARVNKNPVNFNEECLFEAAISAALKARFDQNAGAPTRQAGTITFHFQPQDR